MKKNIFSTFAISILLCLPFFASAQNFEVGGIAYNVLSTSENTVEVTSKLNSTYHGNIKIPDTVVYNGVTYDVVALGERAFYSASLSGVTIPSSVTRIKYGCFMYANTPYTINVPASVTEIEQLAFSAYSLRNINVHEDNPNYRTIDGMLFSKDTATFVECPIGKSGTITLPQNTTCIAQNAFSNCSGITTISLNEGLRSIGSFAFRNCMSLTNMVIPASVSHIGINIFEFCYVLNNVNIASGNTHYYMDGLMLYSINGDTLLSCHISTDSLFLPNTLRAVGGFGGNNSVRYVHIPDGVTTILENAFNYSTLGSIEMPSRMAFIDEYAFYGCESLNRVVMPDSLDRMGVGCFSYCGQMESFDIPKGLRVIPKDSFDGCYGLRQVNFSDDVEVIDTIAFAGCLLESLLFPSSLRVVRNYAFATENDAYDVVFSAPVDTIEANAFYWNSISTLKLRNVVPPVTTNEGCLNEADVESIIIPCGSLGAYLADGYWGQYADKYTEDCGAVEDAADGKIVVYPNPVTDRLSIIGATGCRYVELVSLLGHTVLMCETSDSNVEIDVSRLERGTYFLRLHYPDSITTSKVVIR